MDNAEQSLSILSLCSGMCGLERGLERAFFRLNWPEPKAIAYVEIEAFVCWNLVKQMEQGLLVPAPVNTNLKTINWEVFRGKVFGITGGYPCQPFSVAGKQGGTDDPRHLWPYIKEGVRTIRPVFCFFENVRNHLNIGYEQVKADLEGLGYTVREGIYSAEETGAPHKRDRLFVLAILDNANGSPAASEIPARRNTAGLSGSNLWHSSKSNECGTRLCEKFRQRTVRGSGNELADSNDTGLQGWNSRELQECSGECTTRTSSASEKWPARPGEDQHEWEHPRIESKLGFSINGYNFREDLLRLSGNGVVEDAAEIAFIDLLRKHSLVLPP